MNAPVPSIIALQWAPLSFAQQRLWFLSRMEGFSEAYHMALALRLHGALDVRALRRALDRIVFRHEALRTTFHRDGDEPVQRIAPPDSGFSSRVPRCAFSASRRNWTLLTPGISTGYWKPRNSPAAARALGASASRSWPANVAVPAVTS